MTVIVETDGHRAKQRYVERRRNDLLNACPARAMVLTILIYFGLYRARAILVEQMITVKVFSHGYGHKCHRINIISSGATPMADH